VARSLHALPGHASVYAAATKYLVPMMLEDAMNSLSVILGARFYLREGEHAIFGKHARDLPPLSIGHAGGVSCQLTILPQLPSVLKPSTSDVPAAVFDPGAELDDLDLDQLRLRSPAGDPLLASLKPGLETLRSEVSGPVLDLLTGQVDALFADIAAMPLRELGLQAAPSALRLTERYALLLATAACVGVQRHRNIHGTAWIELALARLAGRLTPLRATPDVGHEDALFTELMARADGGRGFCLDEDPVSRALS
jgi:hypothetical protein